MARGKKRNAKRHKAAHQNQQNDSNRTLPLSEVKGGNGKDASAEGISTGADFVPLDDLGDFPKNDFPRAGKKRRYEDESDSDIEYERRDDTIDVHPWFDLMPDETIEKPSDFSPIIQKEFDCFLKYMEPTIAECTLRKYLVHKIQCIVHKLDPRATVHVFGSFAMNMYLPNSDMDLVVQGASFSLKALAKALERNNLCRRAQVISKAKVPIVKFVDTLTRLQVDISLGPANGIQSAETVRSMVRTQPALRPLAMAIKHFLALRNLNEVFTGGMGGYAIVCMVMGFLQAHPLVANSRIDPMRNLAPLLLDFLKLYGGNFNYQRVGIDVAAEQTGLPVFYPLTAMSTDKSGRSVFRIRDPDDYDNDLGVKSYRADYVVKAFKGAYDTMIVKGGSVWKQVAKMDTIDFKKDGRVLSIMKPVFYIPCEMQSIRKHLYDVYTSRSWLSEPEAQSFKL